MLIRAAASVAGLTAVSRCAGFLRDIVIAATLGASPVADAFLIALKLPNIARRLFAEGAFDAAFVPMVSAPMARGAAGRAEAVALAEQALSLLCLVLLLTTVAAEAAMPWLVSLLAPGFVADPPRLSLAIDLARITFPYLLFIALAASVAGLLNAAGFFAVPAAAPILLNLVLIAAGLAVGGAHALAWGVAIGGVLQLVWLVTACRAVGLRLRPRLPRLTPEMRVLLRRAAPGAAGAGLVQLNLMAGTMIATLLPSGAVTTLYLADRVTQLPVGLVGAALGTALLPMLTRAVAAGEQAAADAGLARAIDYALLIALPAAFGLGQLAEPVARVLFQRGAFDAAAAVATAAVLRAYAVGLPAYVLLKLLGPACFARHDMRSPLGAAFLSLIVTVATSLALLPVLGAAGIAIATALAAWLSVAILGVVLWRRGWLALDAISRRILPRVLGAVLLMAAALAAGSAVAPNLPPLLSLASLVGLGILVYFAAILGLGVVSPADIAALRRARQLDRAEGDGHKTAP
jgi:putative peptidoglycan lipid II flippase